MTSRRSAFLVALTLLIIGTLFLAACSSSQDTTTTPDPGIEEIHDDDHVEEQEEEHAEGEEHDDDGHEGESDSKYAEHEHADVPAAYADLVNPFTGDADAIAVGQELFLLSCASCHGESGAGDGAAAETLDPKPANLADADMVSDLSDGYFFWRISEGGIEEPFNSAMPPWGSTYDETQIWQLVSFIRSLQK
ncbi:MAG: c-type cytochrome [Anaerolineales bacterium]|nr:c-type cytochrome [Anaerolineales bacterium]